jgi:hypothetical protein
MTRVLPRVVLVVACQLAVIALLASWRNPVAAPRRMSEAVGLASTRSMSTVVDAVRCLVRRC